MKLLIDHVKEMEGELDTCWIFWDDESTIDYTFSEMVTPKAVGSWMTT